MFPSSTSSSSSSPFLGAPMPNTTSLSAAASFSDNIYTTFINHTQQQSLLFPPPTAAASQPPLQKQPKKKRNLPGNPDPEAEVIALSPKTLMATNRFVCEICKKGFQRDQNLQLHRRGHNLPWKLKQRKEEAAMMKKKAYVCPEPSCVHHHPSRALGDLTGIKKHFCRKHGEKKWKCSKCSKIYAVQSDWKAHSKTCGTREYRCDCGTLFSRKDSFITHRAFCDALAEESARLSAHQLASAAVTTPNNPPLQQTLEASHSSSPLLSQILPAAAWQDIHIKPESHQFPIPSPLYHHPPPPSHHLSATALLQKAATLAATQAAAAQTQMSHLDMGELGAAVAPRRCQQQQAVEPSGSCINGGFTTWQQKSDRFTRDFLGLTGHEDRRGGGSSGGGSGTSDHHMGFGNAREMLGYGGGAGLQRYTCLGSDVALMKPLPGFGFAAAAQPPPPPETWRDC
ncbi:unnamed protein product [Linum trigynum]|uniref:C2H2-type domain-containing protein n=1 Tax=Linum trigynum TaxID=586398 RepID=A0AAV2EBW8_9ROSI